MLCCVVRLQIRLQTIVTSQCPLTFSGLHLRRHRDRRAQQRHALFLCVAGCRKATERHIDDSFLFEVLEGFLIWRLANDVAGAAEQEQIFREPGTVLACC